VELTRCRGHPDNCSCSFWMALVKATKLGSLVEIPELGGRLWEIVEIYPYRLTNKQLKTHRRLIAL
jgi:hypothetical protein